MKIFGQEIEVKKEFCTFNKGPKTKIETPYINLYVRITNGCQASCDFCEFCSNDSKEFDYFKFYYVISELAKQVRINKISFTGGEPTLKINLLNDCLKFVKGIDKNIFTVINTNGLNIEKIDSDFVDSISLSRHSIKNNDRIFKINLKNDIQTFSEKLKKKIHISCNLIKGEIDSSKKIYEFIDHYSSIGFHDFGFVSLMKVNDYCKDHFIDFSEINLEHMENTIRTKTFEYEKKCKCNNFLTTDSNGIINKVYARHYCDSSNSDSTLVYDLNILKNGFNGAEIKLLKGGE